MKWRERDYHANERRTLHLPSKTDKTGREKEDSEQKRNKLEGHGEEANMVERAQKLTKSDIWLPF